MHQRHRRDGPPPNCGNVSHDVLSCYPTAGQKVVQDNTLVFVWNNQVPAFLQAGAVDVYLFHADESKTEVTAQTAIPNSQGRVSFTADDGWWWKGLNTWTGTNQTFPMFFVVAPVGIAPLTADSAGFPPQAQFSAIETRAPNSVSASPTGKTTTTHSSTTSSPSTHTTTSSSFSSTSIAPAQTTATNTGESTSVASLTSSPQTSHSTSRGGIVGGIVGGLLFILAVLGFMIVLRRRARIRRRQSTARHQKMRQINASDGTHVRRGIFPLPTSQSQHNSSPSQQQLRPRRSPSPSPSLDRTGVLSWEHNEQEPLGPNPFADRVTLSSSASEASFEISEDFDRNEMVSPLYDVDARYTVSVEDQDPHHLQGASHSTEPIP